MKKTLLLLLCLTSGLWGTPNLKVIKQPIQEQFLIESYSNQSQNLHHLIGYYLSYPLNPYLGFIWGTSWAISGDYGGYGTASFGAHFKHNITPRIYIDGVGMFGAGGHAHLKLGNGTVWIWQIGTGVHLSPHLSTHIRYGQFTFPTGTFRGNVTSLGIQYAYDLLMPANKQAPKTPASSD